jgi:ADP-ribose pyrophosphatase YjhB (NUDIX family)
MNFFQEFPQAAAWKKSVELAGNRVEDSKVMFKWEAGGKIFAAIWWAKVWIPAEKRYKENEFVFSRVDLALAVIHGEDMDGESEVVLVREFRTPSRTSDGLVVECPSGSVDAEETPMEAAGREVLEETGLDVSGRLRLLASRQACATLSAHFVHAYEAVLPAADMEEVKKISGKMLGENSDERTYISVVKISDVLSGRLEVDWITYGAVAAAWLSKKAR